MHTLPTALRHALAGAVGDPAPVLAAGTTRLIERYQAGAPAEPGAPILRGATDAAAYATYRMPATYAAVRAALQAVAELVPRYSPSTHLDVGGGTGAAVWAAADVWPGLVGRTVLEQVAEVRELGRRLAAGSADLGDVSWLPCNLDDGPVLPAADLVTVSYVLGELQPRTRSALVSRLAEQPGTVVVVEPGTPGGYERVLAVRDELAAAGRHVVAPCPHQLSCPIVPGQDWCHFATRVERSALHRRVKAGTLGFEDEKFAYVALSADPVARAPNRVLRHPVQRKGLVSLQLCTGPEPGLRDVLVAKREGSLYRSARDTGWGDAWPPVAG